MDPCISCIVAAAIVIVFEAAVAGKTATGREGYYFAGAWAPYRALTDTYLYIPTTRIRG